MYHPPKPECHNHDLIEFLIDTCERLLVVKPNSKIIITGDLNQLDITSTTLIYSTGKEANKTANNT